MLQTVLGALEQQQVESVAKGKDVDWRSGFQFTF